MEACCGAHHLGRVLRQHGHEVRLMSPEYVQPYVKAQKNDERDAEAIAEAATRPTMRFVELKSEEQLDAQVLHRARSRLVGQRTALINQLRAVLIERGIVVAKGPRRLEEALNAMLDDGTATPITLSPRIRLLIEDMRLEWRELDRRIAALNLEFIRRAREDLAARRLATIPGFGALNATGHGRDLPPGARPCRLAWARAPPGNHGRQAAPARHHQARQHVLAHAADPRCPCGPAIALGWCDAARRLAARPHGKSAQEQGCRGAGRQAGPDRLGGAALWRDLHQGSQPAGDGLIRDELPAAAQRRRPTMSVGGGHKMA